MSIATIAFGALSVHLSLSRAVEIGLIAAFIFMLLTAIGIRSSGPTRWSIVILGTVGVAVGCIFSWDRLVDLATSINSQREGSLVSRSAIYEATWMHIQALKVPLAGFGVKPQLDYLVASVATHSTLLGLTFRGGIIALVVYLLFLAIGARTAWRTKNVAGAGIVVLVAAWTVLEDFDPGHLVPLGLVVCFASRSISTQNCEAVQASELRQVEKSY
ncbi:O-antigen ligase family protein [Rhodococcus pyridinivorans]|uniref:O-antigen ligase family protein n=1 Tax=Rhodococcus pyridinivorans TaxID=103816 RepID=UPI0036CD317B